SGSLGERCVSYEAVAGGYLLVFRGLAVVRCRRGDLNPRIRLPQQHTGRTQLLHKHNKFRHLRGAPARSLHTRRTPPNTPMTDFCTVSMAYVWATFPMIYALL